MGQRDYGKKGQRENGVNRQQKY